MDLKALQQKFGANHDVSFSNENGLVRVHVKTAKATAMIFLQGAHLAAWQPAGFEPVIFLSRKSDLAPGKPIRGGVPVAFPWFATDAKQDRIDGHPGPSHGFARVQEWELKSVRSAAGVVSLVLSLGATEMSRSMGFDHFRLSLEFRIGKTLAMLLTVTNEGEVPLKFEEALHSYYHVADVHESTVSGLEPTGFIDKTDEMKRKPAEGKAIGFTKKTDSVYNGTTATGVIHDVAGRRKIEVSKRNSNSTIVWNPWAAMPDLGEWDWHNMVAVETGNVGDDAVTLAPHGSHTMEAHVSVERG